MYVVYTYNPKGTTAEPLESLSLRQFLCAPPMHSYYFELHVLLYYILWKPKTNNKDSSQELLFL